MAHDFEKIFELISRTGDKFIIDFNGNNFVVMDLAAYEKILHEPKDASFVQELSEEDLIEKINTDIAEWRQNQEAPDSFLADFKENKDAVDSSKCSEIDTEDQYYLEPIA
jgi:hypothetical protein